MKQGDPSGKTATRQKITMPTVRCRKGIKKHGGGRLKLAGKAKSWLVRRGRKRM